MLIARLEHVSFRAGSAEKCGVGGGGRLDGRNETCFTPVELPPPSERARHYWEVPEDLVTPTWAEKRRLASRLRELVELCVTTQAGEAELALANRAVEAALAELRPQPKLTFQEGFPDCKGLDELAVFTDRATLVGACNPYAPPMALSFERDTAIARVTFGAVYEGAPGFVHGGIVAAAFDQVFGYLQVRLDTPALTRVLTVHYKKPTPFCTELRLEAKLDRSEGRRHYVVGRLYARDEVTAEAEGVFVALDPSAFQQLFESVK
jgi:acyl-coenzyme A thioesterase PaaI-like protein